MRTLALLVCEDIDAFIKTFLSNGQIRKLKDRDGKKLTDARLKELLNQFDPTVADSYDEASGMTHYSAAVVNAMAISNGDEVEFNFGMIPNEEINFSLLNCGELCIRYLDLHLSMLKKIIESDEWYDSRTEID